jgi:hypothetical protein
MEQKQTVSAIAQSDQGISVAELPELHRKPQDAGRQDSQSEPVPFGR